jgi:hypothetical protein
MPTPAHSCQGKSSFVIHVLKHIIRFLMKIHNHRQKKLEWHGKQDLEKLNDTMKIPLQKAVNLLHDCSAIILDDDALVYPSLDDIVDDQDNQFMYCEWEVAGCTFNSKFIEGNNKEVDIRDNYMILIDIEGEPRSIKLLEVIDLSFSHL